MRRLPGRLTAPDPGWSVTADVVVIGSGIAGLTAALRLKEELGPEGGKVLVVTKDRLAAGSTRWAQGGIAAALGPEDTPAEHELDTLVAGAGACDPDAVRALVTDRQRIETVDEGQAHLEALQEMAENREKLNEGLKVVNGGRQ